MDFMSKFDTTLTENHLWKCGQINISRHTVTHIDRALKYLICRFIKSLPAMKHSFRGFPRAIFIPASSLSEHYIACSLPMNGDPQGIIWIVSIFSNHFDRSAGNPLSPPGLHGKHTYLSSLGMLCTT